MTPRVCEWNDNCVLIKNRFPSRDWRLTSRTHGDLSKIHDKSLHGTIFVFFRTRTSSSRTFTIHQRTKSLTLIFFKQESITWKYWIKSGKIKTWYDTTKTKHKQQTILGNQTPKLKKKNEITLTYKFIEGGSTGLFFRYH